MEDALLDMSQDELVIKETQHGDSSATFSRNLVDRFGIIGHNTQTGSETVNPTDNMLRDFDQFRQKIRRLSHKGYNKMIVRKFPLKRINKYQSKQANLLFHWLT